MIRSVSSLPIPCPRNRSRTKRRFISAIRFAASHACTATQPAGSPSLRAISSSPDGGAYCPGNPANSSSNFWKERSNAHHSAYSAISCRASRISVSVRTASIVIDIHPVSVARRLRDDEKPQGAVPGIADSVPDARRDRESLPRYGRHRMAVQDERGAALQHIKKLLGSAVEVQRLSGARREALLNHMQTGGLREIPPVAATAPLVMFGGVDADRFHGICGVAALAQQRQRQARRQAPSVIRIRHALSFIGSDW